MTTEKLYADRDICEQDAKGGFYFKHVLAMTAEGLHSKSDIAAELAHRDIIIQRQKDLIVAVQSALQDLEKEEHQSRLRGGAAGIASAISACLITIEAGKR